MWYIKELALDFFRFHPSTKERRENVGEALEDWIDFGSIVECTGGDFSRYQAVVIQILLIIYESDTLSQRFDRPLLNPDEPIACLDRGFWEAAVFRRKYGDRRESEDDTTT